MAKSSKKSAAPAAPQVDQALLSRIVNGTQGADGFLYVSEAESAPLVAAGLVEVNPSADALDANGNRQTRATEQGINMAKSNTPATSPAAAESTAPAPAAKQEFALVSNVPMPQSARRGGARGESYPFSKMEVGHSFFIAATAEKPNPERSYASTVASARNRFATKTDQTRQTRKGNTVPVLSYTREFSIRGDVDGAPYGQPGVKGAAVWRTK